MSSMFGNLSTDEERPAGSGESVARSDWTFLTNHSHVLLCLSQNPQARLRDVAGEVGITERAVQRIVLELETAGVIERTREGRRNRYRIIPDAPLRHPVESHCTVGQLVAFVRDVHSS